MGGSRQRERNVEWRLEDDGGWRCCIYRWRVERGGSGGGLVVVKGNHEIWCGVTVPLIQPHYIVDLFPPPTIGILDMTI